MDKFRCASSLLVFFALVCVHRADAEPVYPLKLSDSGTHLADQSNEPFLVNGDTPWSLIVELTKTEATQYLEDRRARGFNAVLVELIENYFGGPPNRDGELPFLVNGDFSTPNEAYFAHADWVINQAAQNGMVVFLTPAYLGSGCGSQGWCQEMLSSGTAKVRDYGRWIGARYASFPNIVWVAGGDTDAHNTSGAFALTEAMMEGILETDTQHLVTAHCNRGNAALDCYAAPWLELNSTYSECTHTAVETRTDYNRRSTMPFFYIEGSYEGEVADGPGCARIQAYQSILGGSTGHFYGNSPIWLFASGWQAALDAPGGASMVHLRNLFESRSWHTLVPDFDHAALIQGFGSIDTSDYVGSAVTADAATLIAYLPSSRAVTVDLTRLSGSSVNAWWYNPRTGEAILTETLASTQAHAFSPPASGDWVLVIDDVAANLSAPGQSLPKPKAPKNLWVE